MNHSDKKLFLAVFFNEPDKIRALVEERNGNIELLFSIPDKYCELWLRFKGKFAITAFELALMLADSLFDLKEYVQLKNYPFFNPSEEYQKITGSIAFLKNYTKLHDIDYNRYYNLISSIDDDEEYLWNEDMKDYLEDFTHDWLVNMLERLYESGSSSRLYRIINEVH